MRHVCKRGLQEYCIVQDSTVAELGDDFVGSVGRVSLTVVVWRVDEMEWGTRWIERCLFKSDQIAVAS